MAPSRSGVWAGRFASWWVPPAVRGIGMRRSHPIMSDSAIGMSHEQSKSPKPVHGGLASALAASGVISGQRNTGG